MNKQKTFVIMAGGTGGHIFPGVAVAKALMRENHRVLWLGSIGGMEERIVRQEGIAITLLAIKALRGKGLLALLTMPFRLSKSIWQARRFFKREHVDVAISFGGFVAAPGGLATRFCATRLVIHEQNSVLGMTNKYLSKHADRVLTGFDLDTIPNGVWVGNPVRQQIEALNGRIFEANSPLKLLVLGGSLGAQSLNTLIPQVLRTAIKKQEVVVKHQCGRNKLQATQEAYGDLVEKVEICEFVHNMASAYQWADVCICRAGALTIAEITAVGLPSILVPYPYAVDDHQTQNAQYLLEHDAALLWQEKNGAGTLEKVINQLFDCQCLKRMNQALSALFKPQVAKVIAQHCEEVAE